MLIFFFAVAILAPVISPGDANDIVARRHLAPSSEHWFGTTGAGQDVFDQTVWGARQTLLVGIAVATWRRRRRVPVPCPEAAETALDR